MAILATSLLAFTTLVTSAVGGDERDTVHMKSGSPIKGRVLLELPDRVAVLVGSRERWVERDKIERIDSVAAHQRELIRQLRGVTRDDAEQQLALAKFCDEHQLEYEAALLRWSILANDPQNDAANEALGHKRSAKGWLVRADRGFRPLDRLEKTRADWSKAWRLRSEHFELRCDRGLRTTVDLLLELECFYDGFFDLFQQDLQLRHLTEPVQVYVYGDREQFPSMSNNVGAFFSLAENILYTYVAQNGRPYALYHEATHALLHNLVRNSRRSRGGLPAWLDEGWAEFMQAVVVPGRAGRASVDEYNVLDGHLRTIGDAEKPYTLHRVLNFKLTDFQASSKQQLKYAQSYALFLYMRNGASGSLRGKFYEYVQSAMSGKGQASTFRRMFKRELNDIERAYAQQ
ncbi:MAG: DUF1570 domain-containing protein [Planctomycetota bacterium]